MEEKKLKEIEAKLNQLIREDKKNLDSNIAAPSKRHSGIQVIRRRKGHMDLHIA